MLFLGTTDTHLMMRHLLNIAKEACDEGAAAVIHAGDHLELTEFGRYPALRQVADHQEVFSQICQVIPFITCSGNHDLLNESNAWLKEPLSPNFTGDESHVVLTKGGVTVVVTTVPYLANNALGLAEVGREMADEIPGAFWMVLQHEPPKDSKTAGGGGSMIMRRLVHQFKPDVFLCGHLHFAPLRKGGDWSDLMGETLVINPGRNQNKMPNTVRIEFHAGQRPRATITRGR